MGDGIPVVYCHRKHRLYQGITWGFEGLIPIFEHLACWFMGLSFLSVGSGWRSLVQQLIAAGVVTCRVRVQERGPQWQGRLNSWNPKFALFEGSLEVKLPTIWRDEKQSREEA
jgi:hypothetical protein